MPRLHGARPGLVNPRASRVDGLPSALPGRIVTTVCEVSCAAVRESKWGVDQQCRGQAVSAEPDRATGNICEAAAVLTEAGSPCHGSFEGPVCRVSGFGRRASLLPVSRGAGGP